MQQLRALVLMTSCRSRALLSSILDNRYPTGSLRTMSMTLLGTFEVSTERLPNHRPCRALARRERRHRRSCRNKYQIYSQCVARSLHEISTANDDDDGLQVRIMSPCDGRLNGDDYDDALTRGALKARRKGWRLSIYARGCTARGRHESVHCSYCLFGPHARHSPMNVTGCSVYR